MESIGARFHAVVLVLDQGRDLHPLVLEDTPPELLPVANRAVLSYSLRLLQECHVTGVSLVVAGKSRASKLVDWLSHEYLEPGVAASSTSGAPASSSGIPGSSANAALPPTPSLIREVIVVPEGYGSADAVRALLSHRSERTAASCPTDSNAASTRSSSSVLVSTWGGTEQSASDSTTPASAGETPSPWEGSRNLLILDAFVISDLNLGAVAAAHCQAGAAVTSVLIPGSGAGGADVAGSGGGEKDKDKAKAGKKAGVGSRDVVGLDATTGKQLLFFSSEWKGKTKEGSGGSFPLPRELLAKPGGFLLHSDLQDSRCYVFNCSSLSPVLASHPKFSCLRRDVIPFLVQQQWVEQREANKARLLALAGTEDGLSRVPSYSTAQPLGQTGSNGDPAASLASRTRCSAYVAPSSVFWCRVQSLSSYSEANHALLSDKAVHLTGLTLSESNSNILHPSVTLGPKSAVGAHCMIGEGSQLAEKCSVKRSLLGRHCRVGAGVKLSDCVVMDYVTLEPGCVLQNCTVASNATVKEFRTLKDCKVGPYAVVSKDEKEAFLSSS